MGVSEIHGPMAGESWGSVFSEVGWDLLVVPVGGILIPSSKIRNFL